MISNSGGQEVGLKIETMRKSSPMEIVFSGIGVALSAAVIFSGGEAEVAGIKFKLAPLGEGVKSMRNASGEGCDRGSDNTPNSGY